MNPKEQSSMVRRKPKSQKEFRQDKEYVAPSGLLFLPLGKHAVRDEIVRQGWSQGEDAHTKAW